MSTNEVTSATIQAIRTTLSSLVVSPTAYSSLPMMNTMTTPTSGLSAPSPVNPASLYVALVLPPPSASIVGNSGTNTSNDADAIEALHAQVVSVLNVKALVPITLDITVVNYDPLRCASCGRRIPRTWGTYHRCTTAVTSSPRSWQRRRRAKERGGMRGKRWAHRSILPWFFYANSNAVITITK
ncbi:hypothetical protein GUJ93_ZPchr0013g37725 [Zizania palustris]|uniref:Uncharacterized protein n=1 Tax=Zizania palustris TaxID=103762 RepID=A0A8J6BZB0_ZIZPA|nr:hypothetical protein GUJ93_ZPchr0013g37725 [Zizania palustris]